MYFVSLTVAHLGNFWFQSLVQYLLVSENCATDFFHNWIKSPPCSIFTTGTSCCGRKYKCMYLGFALCFFIWNLSSMTFLFRIFICHIPGASVNVQGISVCLCTMPLPTHLHWYENCCSTAGYLHDFAHLSFCFCQAACLSATKLHENDW